MRRSERLEFLPSQPEPSVLRTLDVDVATLDRVIDLAGLEAQHLCCFGYPQKIVGTTTHGISSYPVSSARWACAVRP